MPDKPKHERDEEVAADPRDDAADATRDEPEQPPPTSPGATPNPKDKLQQS